MSREHSHKPRLSSHAQKMKKHELAAAEVTKDFVPDGCEDSLEDLLDELVDGLKKLL